MIKPLGRVSVLTLAVLLLIGRLWLEPARAADSLNFFVDYGYATTSTETLTRQTDGTTVTTQNDSDFFSQEYRLLFDKILYPNLTLRGGGTFVRTDTSTESDGVESDSTNIRKNPFVDLILGSPMFSGGLGVNRFQDEARGNDGSRTILTRDMYSASLGWKPFELPSFNLRTTRTETYDDNRLTLDTVQQQVQFSSRYQPHKTTDLSYSANLDRNQNILSDTETRSMTQSGRVSFADRFFNNRMNLSSTYSVSQQTNEVMSGAGGEFDLTVFISDTELFTENLAPPLKEPRDIFPAGQPGTQITAPLVLPVSSQINIEPLNIALDFGQQQTVNVVRIYVDSNLNASDLANLQNNINAFNWRVFGEDASNNWQEILPLQSKTFNSEFGKNFFELRFATQQTEHLKIIVTPRKVGNNTINITRSAPNEVEQHAAVETLLRQTATSGGGNKTATSAHMYNLASRVRILENPGLDYNLSLFYRLNNPGSNYQLFVSNGPSLYHRLRPWLTGNAMFARDDSLKTGQTDQDVTYRYGAGLTAQPLPTLNSNLNYSGRMAQQAGEKTGLNSFSLNNRAALYPGLDLLLGGALSFASQAREVESESSQLNLGLNIVPHRTMSWNLIGFLSRTSSSGGDQADSVSTERRGQVSVSYSPVTALSIFAASDVVIRDDDTRTLQNYGISWSPFRDGTLQVGFSYFETVRPEDETLDRVLSPSLTWQIRQGTYLDLNYAMIESSTAQQDIESISFNARLRAMF